MGSAFKSRGGNPNKIINSRDLGFRRAAFSRSFLIILGAPLLMGPIGPTSAIRLGAEQRNQRSSADQAICRGARAMKGGAPIVREGASYSGVGRFVESPCLWGCRTRKRARVNNSRHITVHAIANRSNARSLTVGLLQRFETSRRDG